MSKLSILFFKPFVDFLYLKFFCHNDIAFKRSETFQEVNWLSISTEKELIFGNVVIFRLLKIEILFK